MSKIKFMSLPHQCKAGHRFYIVQISGKHCIGTEYVNVPYGRNGEEWLQLKDIVETTLKFMLDEEPHIYTQCGMQMVENQVIDFEEVAKDMEEIAEEQGKESDESDS